MASCFSKGCVSSVCLLLLISAVSTQQDFPLCVPTGDPWTLSVTSGSGQDRIGQVWAVGNNADTVSDCNTACRTLDNSTFSALRRRGQNGAYADCYCSNILPTSTADTCNRRCEGVPCGGQDALSVRPVCNVGKHGSDCQLDCSPGCSDTLCHVQFGQCRGGCKNQRYGTYCDQRCPNCDNNRCFQDSGICERGCDRGFYTPWCNTTCPTDCRGNVCGQENGDCTNGCEDGHHGSQCELDCPANCANMACNQVGGSCDDGCEHGFYESHCNETCSPNCAQTTCGQDDGRCDVGCVDGWYGPKCDQSCPGNCHGPCDRDAGTCSKCVPGYYGNRCDQKCPGNCNQTVCDIDSGVCTYFCITGYFGGNCSNMCPPNCASNICEVSTGQCTLGCEPGFYTSDCSTPCPGRCLSGICDFVEGTCPGRCEDGYFGLNYCNRCCNERCVDILSDISDGVCDIASATDVADVPEIGLRTQDSQNDHTLPSAIGSCGLPVWVVPVLVVTALVFGALGFVTAWLIQRRRLTDNVQTNPSFGVYVNDSVDGKPQDGGEPAYEKYEGSDEVPASVYDRLD